MTEREKIQNAISENEKMINNLRVENQSMKEELLLLCDDKQWFTEVEEDIVVSKRPKKIEKKLIGKVHWKEDFKDEDTGEVITLERCEVVRVNGYWV